MVTDLGVLLPAIVEPFDEEIQRRFVEKTDGIRPRHSVSYASQGYTEVSLVGLVSHRGRLQKLDECWMGNER